jgi:hypothetical protein
VAIGSRAGNGAWPLVYDLNSDEARHFIDVCEESEFAVTVFVKARLSVFKNLSASFFDEVLAKELLQLFLLGGRELLHVFNNFSKGLTHPVRPLIDWVKNTLCLRRFQQKLCRRTFVRVQAF